MKILFDHPTPFFLAHGGVQHQILETKKALEARGVEVEFVRWWDESQRADLIHFFGAAPLDYQSRARAKGMPLVMTVLLTATCNRSKARLGFQGCVVRTALRLPLLRKFTGLLGWSSIREADCVVVGLHAEHYVLRTVYDLPDDRIAIVPLGVPDAYLKAPAAGRQADYLVTTGTITDRKRSLELAQMAHAARVPILFVGRPYEEDDYWRRFSALIDDRFVKHHTHVESSQEMIALLSAARGFVMYSRYENWCLSAHEAAALGLPLLLPGQPWALERFGERASYFPTSDASQNAKILGKFYGDSTKMPVEKGSVPSWDDTALALAAVYSRVIQRG